jgi:hypothetical protein
MEGIFNAFVSSSPFRTTLLCMLRPTDIAMLIQSMKTDLTDKDKEIYLMMWRQLFVDTRKLEPPVCVEYCLLSVE